MKKNINSIKKMVGAASGLIALGALCITTQAAAAQGDVILNEWNAVGPNKFLEDNGTDTFFGQVAGNGGDWIELVVIKNNADLRGFKIEWKNGDSPIKQGALTFSNSTKWNGGASGGGLKAGTIIVLREDASADTFPDRSGLACDISVDNGSWDNIIQLRTNGTYVTESGTDWQVDNDDWTARILDNATPTRGVVQSWVGEDTSAADIRTGSGLSSEEVGKLEQDPSANAAVYSPSQLGNYNDGDTSTYGDPNLWNSGANEQCFEALTGCNTCP